MWGAVFAGIWLFLIFIIASPWFGDIRVGPLNFTTGISPDGDYQIVMFVGRKPNG
ncbi:hypothetical protein KIKIMORA_04330 [Brevundimonas phage vB_BpoS-Kikimora]|uniref:Uncharacterized protein n=1 Tax=Brevundimonas phage vB_BpoS-Kikimora TaxID=2948601 RepID=A0A9E7SL88_9CAUD|nr:hypothetical protein KIKIMORA_04330 [Brevundimonas phage vB_BpoS-Kikimora]